MGNDIKSTFVRPKISNNSRYIVNCRTIYYVRMGNKRMAFSFYIYTFKVWPTDIIGQN